MKCCLIVVLFALLYWSVILSIFSCTYYHLGIFFGEVSIQVICPFFNWTFWLLLLLGFGSLPNLSYYGSRICFDIWERKCVRARANTHTDTHTHTHTCLLFFFKCDLAFLGSLLFQIISLLSFFKKILLGFWVELPRICTSVWREIMYSQDQIFLSWTFVCLF